MKTDSRTLLEAWVAVQYEGHRIPVSGKPYMDHVLFVAEMTGRFLPLGYEAGLCHDLIEDTEIKEVELLKAFLEFDYSPKESRTIIHIVDELTDVYTKKSYPGWKKKERKRKEAERLLTISPAAQTVKYADLIYNIRWTIQFQTKKVRKYLENKKALLAGLDKGDPVLHQMALAEIEKGFDRLN